MEDNRSNTLKGSVLFLFLFAIVIAEMAAAFETSMIYSASKELIETFGDTNTTGWFITVYLLTGAGTAAVAGRLGDIYGRKNLITVQLLLGVVGSLISIAFPTFWPILIGRALQGLTASLLPLCYGLIREHVPSKWVPMAIGLGVTGAGGGVIMGLIVGGIIVDNYTWQMIFVASAIFAAVGAALFHIYVPASKAGKKTEKTELLSGLLFVPGIVGLLLFISKGSMWGWTSPSMLALLAASFGILAAWVRRSLRHENPLIDVRLLMKRNILLANIGMMILAMTALQVNLVFSLLLQQPSWTGVGLGTTATIAALVKAPGNVLALVAAPICGYLAMRQGHRFALAFSAVVVAIGWGLASQYHTDIYYISLFLCITSVGTAMTYTALPNIILDAVPANRTSEASGMLIVTRSASMAIGAQIISAVFFADPIINPDNPAVRYPSNTAYSATMMGIALAGLCVALLAFFVSKKTTPAEKAQ
ncbi:MAG: MFS transporter [Kordiimonadaceae bacterium]|nr:MFS transporter [Kordiimonadaceae bacterium]